MRRFQSAAIAIAIALFAGPAAAFQGGSAQTSESASDRGGAYARLLALEIRRRTPRTHRGPGGRIQVTFVVGASGHIVSYQVRSSTHPLLEMEARRILAAVRAPPPPGGSFSASQTFNFREHPYVHILHAAISRRMPKSDEPGDVTALFHLNASGRVDDVKIERASSREHAELVRDALSGLKVPPPPGGGVNLMQVFHFN